jgi:hypothetical protein
MQTEVETLPLDAMAEPDGVCEPGYPATFPLLLSRERRDMEAKLVRPRKYRSIKVKPTVSLGI